ncbi:MAG: putative lipid II flippase FtsW [Kistimonas sp.]|nr:putative lipid II flippase FtsW [Kistimonas sp.]
MIKWKTGTSTRDGELVDFPLVLLMLSCIAMGLVMVSSASVEVAGLHYKNALYFVVRQAVYMGVSLVVWALVMTIPMALWERFSRVLLLGSVGLLVLVLIPGVGREVNGSSRWISLGFVNLQASEVARLALVIYTASWLGSRREQVGGAGWSAVLTPLLVTGLFVFLLLLEPDFGSAVVCLGVTLGLLFLRGVRLERFLLFFLVAAAGAALLILAAPYRLRRLTAYTDPWADQFGAGYQLTQSLIGFGRGSWWGEGLGNGIQKLFFLPEPHTDFIFSVVAEELGLVGALLVIVLLFGVIWRALSIGHRAGQEGQLFSACLAYGVGLLFSTQIFINIGASSGLLPSKGMALPFFSYGGSSLLASVVMVGLLMRIDFERRLSSMSGSGRDWKAKGVVRAFTPWSHKQKGYRRA